MDARSNQPKGGLPSEDLVRAYQLEIGPHPLLSKDDEVRLARRIEDGKGRDTSSTPWVTPSPGLGGESLRPASRGLRRPGGASFKPISGWSVRDRRRTRVGPKRTAMDRLCPRMAQRGHPVGGTRWHRSGRARATCRLPLRSPGSGRRNSGLSPNA
jgi:hypothetical protein